MEPQHILISGAEGSGKTFMIEKLAEEFTARGFLIVKYLYPHSNIVGTESLIKDLDYLLGKKAVVLIDDFDKLLLSMTKGEQKKLIAIFSNMHSPFLVATSTCLDEEFSKHYPLFDQFFNSFQIPGFEKEDLEDLLGEDLYNKVKGNSEFQEIVMKLGGNLNYIKSLASIIYPNYGTEDSLDIVIDENERYFQYRIAIHPDSMLVGRNYITDKRVAKVHTRNGEIQVATWYHFMIPLADYERKFGSIQDFSNIRFMRVFMTGFSGITHLRFATLIFATHELARGE